MHNRIEIAKEFANSINSDDIIKIILFGSVARHEDHKDSDIDILIISNYRDRIWPRVTKEIANTLIEKQELISTHVMSEEQILEINDYKFMLNILQEGIAIG